VTIGWYVHHHGAGHLQRFLAVRPLVPEVVALSSLPRPASVPAHAWIELPLDHVDGEAEDPTAGGALHWAPLRCDGLRRRGALIAEWAGDCAPSALVVDVSAEVVLLARLLGVPPLVVAQRGVRIDPAHRLAYAAAAAVAAPWTEATDLPGCGLPVERTRFVGAISRFDDFAPATAPSRDVLLLVGRGGHALDAADVAAAAEATPERRWHVAGPLRVGHPRVTDHGADADVGALLRGCGVVVATAGGNAIAEVAAARRPLVCLPQPRPFEEQRMQAEALRRADLAEVAVEWPRAAAWPALLHRAEQRDPERWALLHDGRGAERLAAVVRSVAVGERADAQAVAA
jgi:hypothetical protein